MRIGIVTQPLACNYGGILQNFALQQILRRMGHEVWTIDYQRYNWLDWTDNAWRVVAHKLLGHESKFAQTPPKRVQQEMPLRRFVNQNILITTPRTKFLERKVIKKYALEAIVVGSDQVWRPCYNYNIADCFLKFARGLSIKRVAYGASFGTDEWEFTNKQAAECIQLAKLFDGISVRETSGVSLCKKYLNVKATHVADPTLLLHSVDYIKLCSQIPVRKPFIFAYILDPNETKMKQIKQLANRKGIDCFVKSADNSVSKNDTVELWLSYFRDASFVITDSFHGAVFSIIFNKDFYVFSNAKRGNSRFKSLLEDFGQKNRMIDANIPTREEQINWENVNQLREHFITFSEEWLRNKLNN